eukprot:6035458-Prymnesium_polylepis.1
MDLPQLGRFLAAGSRGPADASAAGRMANHHMMGAHGGGGGGPNPAGHSYSRQPGDGAPIDVGRVDALLSQREQARRSRNFDEADYLRGVLLQLGIDLDDNHRMWR